MTQTFLTTYLKKFKKLKNLLLTLFLFYVTERFCHYQTEGFQCSKIISDLSFRPEWETVSLDQQQFLEMKARLNQTYFFLKSGGQCYTFLSEDQQYVLKVFKHHHMRINSPFNKVKLPQPFDIYRLKLLGGKESPEERLNHMFNSCKIAHNELKSETALIYLHLNKSKYFQQPIKLVDKLGITHIFDLDSLEFALQAKAELVYPTLLQLIKEGNKEGAKQRIASLIDLFHIRGQKAILDTDAQIQRNFGFIGEKAIRIDLGNLQKEATLKDPVAQRKLLIKEIEPLHLWLQTRSTELANYVEEELKKKREP